MNRTDENPYRSPLSGGDSSQRSGDSSRTFKSNWLKLSIRLASALVGIVVMSFGTLIAISPIGKTGDWIVLPVAICLIAGGSCLVWWAFARV